MQGTWTMRFRGEKESIHKLTSILNEKEELYDFDPYFTREEKDDIIFEAQSSSYLNNVPDVFADLVEEFPELEAVYCETQMDDVCNTKYIYYSFAGDKDFEGDEAVYEYDAGTVLVINRRDGNPNVIEALMEDYDISREHAEKLLSLFYYKHFRSGERPEAFTFDCMVDGNKLHIDSERVYVECQSDSEYKANETLNSWDGEKWLFVPYGVRGHWVSSWLFKDGDSEFILEIL